MSPVREAKSRQLSREYMADRAWMTEYSPAEREWYLLTALYADDSGYLPWDLPDNAANLYRYDIPRKRETRVAAYVAHFTTAGRFLDHGCGHAYMPGVANHPRGRARDHLVRAEHSQCTGSAPESTGSALTSVPFRSVPFRSSPRAAKRGSKDPSPREARRTNGQDAEPTSLRDTIAGMGLPLPAVVTDTPEEPTP